MRHAWCWVRCAPTSSCPKSSDVQCRKRPGPGVFVACRRCRSMPTYLCKNCLFRPDGGVEGRRQVLVRSSGTYPHRIEGSRSYVCYETHLLGWASIQCFRSSCVVWQKTVSTCPRHHAHDVSVYAAVKFRRRDDTSSQASNWVRGR